MRITHARAYPITVAIALASLLVLIVALHGCATTPTTEVVTHQSLAEPVSPDQHAKILELLNSKRDQVLKVASTHVLESATPQEVIGLACLAHAHVAEVQSQGKSSGSLRSLVAELLGRHSRSDIRCPQISDQWTLDFLTYSRWKTHRASVDREPPSEAEEAWAEFMNSRSLAAAPFQGAAMGVIFPAVVGAVGAAAYAYAVSCVSTLGLVCPIPGETIFAALATSTTAQDGRTSDLIGIGVAQGRGQISAWAALSEDPEALGLALAQALKSLASNYAAALITEVQRPDQPSAKPMPQD